jgi:hypothetical protein
MKLLLSLFVLINFSFAQFPGFPSWATFPPSGGDEFKFQIINQQTTSGQFSTTTGETVTVDWGDGTKNDYTGTNVAWTHTYTTYSGVTYDCKMTNASALTKFTNTVGAGTGIKFDIGDLPRSLLIFSSYYPNTCYGDIRYLPPTMTEFLIYGSNTITGDIAYLPATLTSLVLSGLNTIYGDIATFNPILNKIYIEGYNALSGDIEGMSDSGTLTGLILSSSYNTIYGDVGKFKTTTSQDMQFKTRISDYTSRTYPTTMYRVRFEPLTGYGFSSAEVDQVLIDLARDATTWGGAYLVWMAGNNAPRTSASAAAVTTLNLRGVTVTTNL